MAKSFTVGSIEYTVEPCTAICYAELGDESKRQSALLVTGALNGEKSKHVVFGWDMPESEAAFLDMCDDASAWESDWDVIAGARK